jgi:hypothetical protein
MSALEKSKGQMKFLTHRPKDKLDPGFRIVGMKLRWIAATQTEDRMGRIWRVLRKEEMPPEILKQMRDGNRDMFGQDNTIRSRELILAYATEEAVAEERRMNEALAKSQMAQVTSKSAPGGNKHVKVQEAELSQVSSSEFFNQ